MTAENAAGRAFGAKPDPPPIPAILLFHAVFIWGRQNLASGRGLSTQGSGLARKIDDRTLRGSRRRLAGGFFRPPIFPRFPSDILQNRDNRGLPAGQAWPQMEHR